MQQQTLKIKTTDRDPFAIVELDGVLAGPTVYELKHEGNRLVQHLGRHYVVLDMEKVTFIDSGAIGVVMYLVNMCKQMGGRMAAVGPSAKEALGSLYQVSLQKFVDFHPDSQTALAKICEKCGLNPPRDIVAAQQGDSPGEGPAGDRLEQLEGRLDKIESLLERIAGMNQDDELSA